MGLAAARLAPLGSGSLIQDRLELPVLGIALERFKFRLRLNLLRFRISNDFGFVGVWVAIRLFQNPRPLDRPSVVSS